MNLELDEQIRTDAAALRDGYNSEFARVIFRKMEEMRDEALLEFTSLNPADVGAVARVQQTVAVIAEIGDWVNSTIQTVFPDNQ